MIAPAPRIGPVVLIGEEPATERTGGHGQAPRLTEVNGSEIDLAASGYLLFFVYPDRPGVVGAVGAALGEAG